MVSFGRVSKPVFYTDENSFPEKWLPDGTPYEFRSTPTKDGLPSGLREMFHKALMGYGRKTKDGRELTEVLGIFHDFHFHSGHEHCKSIEEVTAQLGSISVETNDDGMRASVQNLESREVASLWRLDIKTAWCIIWIMKGHGFLGPYLIAQCQCRPNGSNFHILADCTDTVSEYPLRTSSFEWKLKGSAFSAIVMYKDDDGRWRLRQSDLELDDHIGNDDGDFSTKKTGFSGTSSCLKLNVLQSGRSIVMSACMLTDEGHRLDRTFELDLYIVNNNGNLKFNAP